MLKAGGTGERLDEGGGVASCLVGGQGGRGFLPSVQP